MAAAEEVHLALPAAPEYIRLARLTVAGLASRMGFGFDEVEDLRIAVDELCYLLVGPEGHPGTIALTYTVEPGRLTVEGEGDGDGALDELSPFSQRILAAVADSHEIRRTPGAVAFRVVRTHRDD